MTGSAEAHAFWLISVWEYNELKFPPGLHNIGRAGEGAAMLGSSVASRSVAIVGAAVIVALVLHLLTADRTGGPVANAPPATQATEDVPSATPPAATGRDRTAIIQNTEDGPAWTPVDLAQVDPNRLPRFEEAVDARVLVALADRIGAWEVGRRIAVPVPQTDRVFSAVVERIERGLGSNRSYVGSFAEFPSPYSFVITVGERHTFATLGTPDGVYELVGNGEFAWLMSLDDLPHLSDYSQSDYLTAEEVDVHP